MRPLAAALAAACLAGGAFGCGGGDGRGPRGRGAVGARHAHHAGHRTAPGSPGSAAAAAAVARLDVPAQVAQLFAVALPGVTTDGGALTQLSGQRWGAVLLDHSNYLGAGQLSSLTATIAATARSAGALPPLVIAAQDGGPGTAFPDLPPAGEAALARGTATAARSAGLLAARRLRTLGIGAVLAPLADVDIPDGPLSGRLFGDAPRLVARLAVAEAAGFAAGGVAAIAGHFPGEGAASADPDQRVATVGGPLDQLAHRDLVPFAALARSAPAIQLSNALYAAFDGVTPATLLKDPVSLLRGRYRFRGLVVSGDLDAAALASGGTEVGAAVAALEAGADLLVVSGSPALEQRAYEAVLAAVQHGHLARARVRDAAQHVLALKARFGLLGG